MKKYLERDLKDEWAAAGRRGKLKKKQNLAFTWSNLKCNYEIINHLTDATDLRAEEAAAAAARLSCARSQFTLWRWHAAAKCYRLQYLSELSLSHGIDEEEEKEDAGDGRCLEFCCFFFTLSYCEDKNVFTTNAQTCICVEKKLRI